MPGIVACYKLRFAICRGRAVLRAMRQRNVYAGQPGRIGFATYPCPRCQHRCRINSRFCGRCGLNITPAEHAAARQPANFTSNPPKRAPTSRTPLPPLRRSLSCAHKILRPLRVDTVGMTLGPQENYLFESDKSHASQIAIDLEAL